MSLIWKGGSAIRISITMPYPSSSCSFHRTALACSTESRTKGHEQSSDNKLWHHNENRGNITFSSPFHNLSYIVYYKSFQFVGRRIRRGNSRDATVLLLRTLAFTTFSLCALIPSSSFLEVMSLGSPSIIQGYCETLRMR
jgi:hypothetical protein